jgi:hypothetical protein
MVGGAAFLAVSRVINDQDTMRRRALGRFIYLQRQALTASASQTAPGRKNCHRCSSAA